MPLSLLAGPANAGKVALLLERYLDALDSDPILIVPNRPDVDRAERELLTRAGALVGGSIGTFDDLFERIAQGNGSHRPVISQAQRTLLLRRVVAGRRGPFRALLAASPTRSARPWPSSSPRCSSPASSTASWRRSTRAYRAELDRLGLWDRELERRHAAERAARRPRRVGAASPCSRTASRT